MVWAVDLDDGSMIDALGKGLSRKKTNIHKLPEERVPDWEPPANGSSGPSARSVKEEL